MAQGKQDYSQIQLVSQSVWFIVFSLTSPWFVEARNSQFSLLTDRPSSLLPQASLAHTADGHLSFSSYFCFFFSVFLTLLALSKQETRSYSQQARSLSKALIPSPPPTPGALTKPECQEGSSGKPDDGVSMLQLPLMQAVPSPNTAPDSAFRESPPSCRPCRDYRWGSKTLRRPPILRDGRSQPLLCSPLLASLRISRPPAQPVFGIVSPFGIISQEVVYSPGKTQDWESENICSVPTSLPTSWVILSK